MGVAYQHHGQHADALLCHLHAVRLAPGSGELWYNLALAQQRSGFLADAELSLRRAHASGLGAPVTHALAALAAAASASSSSSSSSGGGGIATPQ